MLKRTIAVFAVVAVMVVVGSAYCAARADEKVPVNVQFNVEYLDGTPATGTTHYVNLWKTTSGILVYTFATDPATGIAKPGTAPNQNSPEPLAGQYNIDVDGVMCSALNPCGLSGRMTIPLPVLTLGRYAPPACASTGRHTAHGHASTSAGGEVKVPHNQEFDVELLNDTPATGSVHYVNLWKVTSGILVYTFPTDPTTGKAKASVLTGQYNIDVDGTMDGGNPWSISTNTPPIALPDVP